MQNWERRQACGSPAHIKCRLNRRCTPSDIQKILDVYSKLIQVLAMGLVEARVRNCKAHQMASGARTPPLPKSRLTGALLTGTPLLSVVPRHCFLKTGHVRSAHNRRPKFLHANTSKLGDYERGR